METIEIIVYIAIAVIAGGMVLLFVSGISPTDMYNGIRRAFVGETRLTYEEVDDVAFPSTAYAVWERCGFGVQALNNTVYVKGTGVMDRARLFATLKKLNFCSTIQSGAEGCGSREDVVFASAFTLPTIVRVECDPVNRKLVLS
jgi:hypothetical protein